MNNLQGQVELLQSEVAYYKELIASLKEAAINAHIADKPELYKSLSEFTHRAIAITELTIEDMYKSNATDSEPYERDLTTERKEDDYEAEQR